MNTLTWDIKPIELLKINTNLLSIISFILLLTMAFLTASVIAEHCGALEAAADAAQEAWAAATARYALAAAAATATCAQAARTRSPHLAALCAVALGAAALAAWDMNRKADAYTDAVRALAACLSEHDATSS